MQDFIDHSHSCTGRPVLTPRHLTAKVPTLALRVKCDMQDKLRSESLRLLGPFLFFIFYLNLFLLPPPKLLADVVAITDSG